MKTTGRACGMHKPSRGMSRAKPVGSPKGLSIVQVFRAALKGAVGFALQFLAAHKRARSISSSPRVLLSCKRVSYSFTVIWPADSSSFGWLRVYSFPCPFPVSPARGPCLAFWKGRMFLPKDQPDRTACEIELPQAIIETFARFLVPEIRKYYDSEQGQREFVEWQKQYNGER